MVFDVFKKKPAEEKQEALPAAGGTAPQQPKAEPKGDWVELDTSHFKEDFGVKVRVETLKDFADTNRIQSLVREGNIVFLKIRGLRQKDLNELKRSVEKLKKTCTAMSGDIVGVDEDFLVLTPDYAKIFRG
jgi:SepF-like predicted cell division protein (DUF552 family)